MSQGGNEKAPDQGLTGLTSTIGTKICKEAQKTDSIFSSACNIYRVPEQLRMVKKNAYTPYLIAIGPLHQKDEHLITPFQGIKMSYTNCLLCRLKMEGSEKKYEYSTVLQDCVKEMKDCIGDARKCYAEVLDLSDDHMLEMMLVDGCFILELVYRSFDESKYIPKEEGQEGKRNGESTSSDLLTPLLQASNEANMETRMTRIASNEANMETRMTRRALNGTTRMRTPLGGKKTGDPISDCDLTDPISDCDLTASTVKQDLVLMENQIPFFVLEKLFRLTVDRIQNSCHRKFSLDDYVFQYFDIMISQEGNSTSSGSATATSCGSPSDSTIVQISPYQMKSSEEDEVVTSNAQRYYYHILHKLHDYYLPQPKPDELHEDHLPQDQTKKKNGSEVEDMPCASELKKAGVKFESVRGKDLFNVEFSDRGWCQMARFKIPLLEIYDNTELFLRNLIAFEQCCPGVSKHFTSYALLMDTLVNSEKDVEVLEKARVMRNHLGARADATNLFNNLCKEVVLGEEENVFADKCKKATTYSERFWPKNLAHVQRTCFASPWTFIAFVVAFIAFAIQIVTFVQSFL